MYLTGFFQNAYVTRSLDHAVNFTTRRLRGITRHYAASFWLGGLSVEIRLSPIRARGRF